MSATGVGSASLHAFSMVDDSMEISSDHGGLNNNDDIDIDIDFTAGPNDEDYMLEDAIEEDVEFKESFDSAPRHDDDIMVDDYNPALEDQHEADNDEQFQDVPDEAPGAPAVADASNNTSTSNHTDSSFEAQIPTSDAAAQIEDSTTEITAPETNEGVNQAEALQQTENTPPGVSSSPKLADPSHDLSSQPGVTTSLGDTTENVTGEETVAAGEDSSSLANNDHSTEPQADPLVEPEAEPETNGDDTTAGEADGTEDASSEKQAHPADIDETYSQIMVSYQDAQYALFSSSEEDDTDSFFLKDRSILQQPISSFLKALRDILQEEIADDDELCIAIDALRLEFGERSDEIDKVTFEELIYLHQQLLRNDGIDSPEPLHFTLGMRPEFAKRYVGLLDGASEGKGLSELIPRDEESEGYDDLEVSIHVEENHDGNEHHSHDGSEHDEISYNDENTAPEQTEENAELDSVDEVPSAPKEESDSVAQHDTTLATHEENVEVEAHDSNELDEIPGAVVTGEGEGEYEEVKVNDELEAVVEPQDEDGELIDYGDDDEDTKHADAQPKNNNADFEAKNEELRRRSLSRAAETESVAEPVDTAPTNDTDAGEAQQLNEQTNDADEIDYDFNELEADNAPQQSYEIEEPHKDEEHHQEHHEYEDHHEYEEVYGDENNGEDGEYVGNEEDGNDAHGVQEDQGDDYYTNFDDPPAEEDNEAFNFDEHLGNEHAVEVEDSKNQPEDLKVITSTVTEISSFKSNATSPHEEVSAESVTVSADTLELDEIGYEDDEDDFPDPSEEKPLDSSNIQQSLDSGVTVDEIDYDDDDGEATTPQESKPESLQHVSSNTPGKRQRSESMSEDALGEGSQEAKRIRS